MPEPITMACGAWLKSLKSRALAWKEVYSLLSWPSLVSVSWPKHGSFRYWIYVNVFDAFDSDLHDFGPVQLSSAWWTRLCADFFKLVNFATPVKSFASIFLGTFLAEKRSRVESSSAERVTPVATKSSRRFEPKKSRAEGRRAEGIIIGTFLRRSMPLCSAPSPHRKPSFIIHLHIMHYGS